MVRSHSQNSSKITEPGLLILRTSRTVSLVMGISLKIEIRSKIIRIKFNNI